MKNFEGLGVAIITPFDANGQVDARALAGITRYLIDGGVDFLVPMGTTGESVTLTDDETAVCIETVLSENAGRLPVLLGCGGADTYKVAANMGQFQKKYAIDGFLSVSPYYNKPSQQGIYLHYKHLAESTDLPIMLYNVPARTSSNISAETTLRLAHDFSNIVATKEASGNFEQAMQIIRDKPAHFSVLSGDDVLALPSIACGFSGLISVTANAFPAEFSRLIHSALSGDYASARFEHYKLLKTFELLFREGNPTGVKAMASVLGLCRKDVRLPLAAASDGLVEEMRRELERVKGGVLV